MNVEVFHMHRELFTDSVDNIPGRWLAAEARSTTIMGPQVVLSLRKDGLKSPAGPADHDR